ncbi:MAG: divalent-cation tolerance protein CutA [Oscillospiraceae bacterium]|nr:divalent-cation tolerance protein CutA [Oscillospiraceae bacterium]
MIDYSMIISTFPDKKSAKSAAMLLVEKRLAACVQLMPIESVYSWQGEICNEEEVMLLIKSKADLFREIASAIKEAHTYEVPEIIQIPITDGFSEYLNWIGENTK